VRWNYAQPAGQQFVSDGKNVYFYSPNTNRVEKMKFKESEDLRAPLAFLLGRLDFRRDFGEFRTRTEGEGQWITAIPKSDRLPYRQVEFLVTRGFQIRQVKIAEQDNSVMEFRFDRERLNPPLGDALFKFQAPAGAEVVETAAPEGAER
jgi:outer membrane lipoprotein carrier protein